MFESSAIVTLKSHRFHLNVFIKTRGRVDLKLNGVDVKNKT